MSMKIFWMLYIKLINFDEVREMAGWESLNTEFSQQRVITKNYTNDLGGEKSGKENADN